MWQRSHAHRPPTNSDLATMAASTAWNETCLGRQHATTEAAPRDARHDGACRLFEYFGRTVQFGDSAREMRSHLPVRGGWRSSGVVATGSGLRRLGRGVRSDSRTRTICSWTRSKRAGLNTTGRRLRIAWTQRRRSGRGGSANTCGPTSMPQSSTSAPMLWRARFPSRETVTWRPIVPRVAAM